ncbi:SDR family oxidoreductase [Longimicrobium terrae]|nr:SDR family oxidoreductase [Longimicrobium terrae]
MTGGGTVLVTGARGFVGRAVCQALEAAGRPVRRALRTPPEDAPGGDVAVVGDLSEATDWSAALRGVDAVVHLAARVHVMNDTAADPEAEYDRVNHRATAALARAAAAAGVRRFVFVSTVKVNGEATDGTPFRESDAPAPSDPYGRSKLAAERAVHATGAQTGLETVVIRPPLVYGPGVRANFAALLGAVARGLPLPLGGVRNRRSLVYVGNLAHAIVTCVDAPGAAGGTFLVSDGPAVSTAELVRRMGVALGRPARLLPVPPGLIRAAAGLLGRSGAAERLTSSLEVDDGALRRAAGWVPPFTLDQGLTVTAADYRSRRGA